MRSTTTAAKSLTGLFARLTVNPTASSTRRLPALTATAPRCLSTTPPLAATNRGGGGGGGKGGGGKKSKKSKGDAPDPRILNLKMSMPRMVPSPLRFGRNRYLRHWTIHRAWLLFQRQQREGKEKELGRMYQSMHNACEELRKTSGPGLRDEGYLYRVALGKQGIYGKNSIPIEYARLQTETPAREPWNHDWKR